MIGPLRRHALLWIGQAVLAVIFSVAGGMELVLPIEAMQLPILLPSLVIRGIGEAEILGAVGLVLP